MRIARMHIFTLLLYPARLAALRVSAATPARSSAVISVRQLRSSERASVHSDKPRGCVRRVPPVQLLLHGAEVRSAD